jgi:hypothetical protein
MYGAKNIKGSYSTLIDAAFEVFKKANAQRNAAMGFTNFLLLLLLLLLLL